MTAVLVIAGTDSSGGAGLARDVATLTRLGVEALAAVTAVKAAAVRTARTGAQAAGRAAEWSHSRIWAKPAAKVPTSPAA